MIKSKKIRRLVSVVLVLVLATQFVFAASAATETATCEWDDGGSWCYTGTVTKNTPAIYVYEQPVSGTKMYHTNGTMTYYSAGYYWIRYHSEMAASDYANYLNDAAAELGFQATYALNAYTNAVPIYAYEDSGYYCMSTDYYGYSGSYYVEVDYGDRLVEEIDRGIFSLAPYGCGGITGYVAYPW